MLRVVLVISGDGPMNVGLREEPLVAVLTPVYNGETYLAECIESVLAQTYSNWRYIIVNNNSTDRTREIAERYARADSRIEVHTYDVLVGVIENHNRAFRLVPGDAKYCKIVSADDWLFPECLSRMVAVAEPNPSVGIVGSYQLSGGGKEWDDWCIKWDQLPYPSTLVPGREISRIHYLGGPYVYGNPTSILYRADLIKGQEHFYPNETAEADTSAICRSLQETDYGFVHQVLSYERVHNTRVTTRSQSFNAYLSSNISDLIQYSGKFLTTEEREQRLKQLMDHYYEFLAMSALKFREQAFWAYHKKRLSELGYPLSRAMLAKAIVMTLFGLMLNPKSTFEKLIGSRPIPGHVRLGRRARGFSLIWSEPLGSSSNGKSPDDI
jgi:glycosyltransferase involved in cell wall biosynthesis